MSTAAGSHPAFTAFLCQFTAFYESRFLVCLSFCHNFPLPWTVIWKYKKK
ncbi:mCG148270 [Mus musculus]|nr:mCG148270 [Mus musculus]